MLWIQILIETIGCHIRSSIYEQLESENTEDQIHADREKLAFNPQLVDISR